MNFNHYNFMIARLIDPDEERAQLAGLAISPEATWMTDGCIAIRVTTPESQMDLFTPVTDIEPAETFSPFLLDRDSALRIAAALPLRKKDSEAPVAVVDAGTDEGERAILATSDNVRDDILRARKSTVEPASLAKALPDVKKASATYGLSPDRLHQIAGMFKKFGADSVMVRAFEKSPLLRFDATVAGQEMTAVVALRV